MNHKKYTEIFRMTRKSGERKSGSHHGITAMSIAMVLLCLTMVSFYLVSGLYARYTTEGADNDRAGVAAFVFDTGTENMVCLSEITKPGDQMEFTFMVRNNQSVAVSEVAEKYRISVSLDGSLPLQCSIVKGSDSSPVITLDSTADVPVLTGEAAEVNMPAFTAAANLYTVTVKWPEDQKNLEYANAGLSELVITIRGQQED